MSDIKLFRVCNGQALELEGHSVSVEKSLQVLIEKHMEAFLGIQFLATEYTTGKTHGGRIDSLGLDENGYPVIIEYKRTLNENVINQGLYYLDWLLDHKAEFTLLVMERLGNEVSKNIDWSSPRLLCIAGDFTKFDVHAVQQINRNIELIRYRKFDNDLILFELVNAVSAQHTIEESQLKQAAKNDKTVTDYLTQADVQLNDLFESLKAFMVALGEDIQVKVLKNYFAFKRLKNFACVEVHPQKGRLLVYAKVDPDSIVLEEGFTRDVRKIGHYGTGELEISISTIEEFEKAKPLILKSYEAS